MKPGNTKRGDKLLLIRMAAVASLLAISATLARGQATRPAATTDASMRSVIAAGPKAACFALVIVRLDSPMTSAEAKQLSALKAVIYRRLPIIDSVAVRIPARNVRGLAELPFVRHISADSGVRKSDEFTVGSSLANIAFSQYGLTGNGVGVAVLDSGVNTLHPDLWSTSSWQSRVVVGASFVSDGNGAKDICGHGTHVAGIVAGNGLLSSGPFFTHTFMGIARRSNVVNVRVLDGTGQGNVSTVIAGVQWAMTNAAQYNIRVMNLSLGHPVGESYTTDPLCQAVEKAWKSGIVVVCAAGNAGRANASQGAASDNEGWGTAWGSIQSPANDPCVITVGAMKSMDGNRADDRIATYSSRGPTRLDFVMKPDIVAPGNQVISLEAWNSLLATVFNGTNLIPWQYYCAFPLSGNSLAYFRLSGTSMASPVIAGAAALMLEKDPTLTPDTVKARLMISADKWADPSGAYNPCTYGAGYVNIPAALACTAVANRPALSPPLTRDSTGAVHVNYSIIIWGNNVIWGLTGLPVGNGGQPGAPPPPIIIWGNNILWGTDVVSGSTIIWGTSVWNDNIIWGAVTTAVDLTNTAVSGE